MRRKIRSFIQRLGFDVHRYHQQPGNLDIISTFNIKTVLDVGANEGQFADEIAHLLPNAEVYAFEPIKKSFEIIEAKARRNPRLHVFPYALGNKNENRVMYRNQYSPSSSLLPMTNTHRELFPHAAQSNEESVQVRRLDDVLSSISLTPEILLNIDVQGYEAKVLEGAQITLAHTRVIIIESSFFSFYIGDDLFADTYKRLTTYGFDYRGALRQKRDKRTGEVLVEDSLYVRRS